MQRQSAQSIEVPAPELPNEPLGDLRFRNLLPGEAWACLPGPVRRRFSRRLAAGDTVVYVGEVVETRLTWLGRVFGQVARFIGGPLPISTDPRVPAVVTVTEDAQSGGQHWTRIYARRCGFPQVIQSSKQFAGATGLEEYVGCGVGMALSVQVEAGALLFRSEGYFIRIGRYRIALPGWVTPGRITVTHAQAGNDRFLFQLDVVHPLCGAIIHQIALFREAKP